MFIHCIGDSHVCAFNAESNITGVYPGRTKSKNIFTYRLGAHTAWNLHRRIGKIFDIKNKYVENNDWIILVIGEIDCRRHLPKIALENKQSFQDVVNECVNRYFENSVLQLKKKHEKLLCFGPIASSIHNITHEDSISYGSCLQRNEITKLFNEKLECKCKNNNIKFFSIFERLLKKDGSTNMKFYRDKIHLNKKARPILMKAVSGQIQKSKDFK